MAETIAILLLIIFLLLSYIFFNTFYKKANKEKVLKEDLDIWKEEVDLAKYATESNLAQDAKIKWQGDIRDKFLSMYIEACKVLEVRPKLDTEYMCAVLSDYPPYKESSLKEVLRFTSDSVIYIHTDKQSKKVHEFVVHVTYFKNLRSCYVVYSQSDDSFY